MRLSKVCFPAFLPPAASPSPTSFSTSVSQHPRSTTCPVHFFASPQILRYFGRSLERARGAFLFRAIIARTSETRETERERGRARERERESDSRMTQSEGSPGDSRSLSSIRALRADRQDGISEFLRGATGGHRLADNAPGQITRARKTKEAGFRRGKVGHRLLA